MKARGSPELEYDPCPDTRPQYPLHLLNLSSVRDLESKVPKDESLRDLEAQRFRANIIGEWHTNRFSRVVVAPM